MKLKHPCAETCSGYTQAREEALRGAIELLRSKEAEIHYMSEPHGLVPSHIDWADWLESKLKLR